MRRIVLLLALCACQKRSAQNQEWPNPTPLLTTSNVACIRWPEGCVFCVSPRPPSDVEDRQTHICNPRQPSQCIDFCTTLAAECATPWRAVPSCIAQTEDEFRRQQFWLEAADRPVAELVGRVVDPESHKVEGARVELADGPTVLADATTGKDGNFRIVVRAGTFLVRISHPGQATLLDTVRLGVEKGGPQLHVFRLSPELRIAGHVTDDLDRPVPQAQVIALRNVQDALSSAEAPTAADGTFQLRGLDNHRYALRVVAFGYRVPETPRVQAPARAVVVKTMRTHILRGTVLDKNDQPLPQAKILLVATGESESGALNQWTSGPDGRYAIADLAPGGYLMWAQQGDRATYPPMRVTLEADDLEPLGVDLQLDHEGSLVTGLVEDEDGHVVAGAHVELAPKWPLAVPKEQVADTARDGKFSVDGLTPGRYEISVRLGPRPLPLLAGPRDVQVPIEQGEEVDLDEPIKVRRRLD